MSLRAKVFLALGLGFSLQSFSLRAASEVLHTERLTPRGEKVLLATHLPEGEGPFPAVVFAPGQGYHKELPILREFAEEGAARGVAVIRLDWAYSASKGEPSEGLGEELEDLRSVLDLAASHPRIDPDQIFLAGKSLGTLVAYRLFRERPELRGLLLYTPLCTSRWTEEGARRPVPIPSAEENYPGLLGETRPVWMGLGGQDPLCQLAMFHGFLAKDSGKVASSVFGGDHGLNLGAWNDPGFQSINEENIRAAVGAGLDWLSLQQDRLRRIRALENHKAQGVSVEQAEAPIRTLGAVCDSRATTFSLWSPDSSQVEVVLEGESHPLVRVADFQGYSEVFQIRVPGDHHGKLYHFRVGGKAVRDPYGKMAEPQVRGDDGEFGAGQSVVLDLDRARLPGTRVPPPPLPEREDAVIYEVHVRDFTISPSSGVSPENRGKFLGMVESGTRFQGVPTGLDHLVELGVTHVQLMPVYDFGSCPDLEDKDCYNWGYDPRNFSVPEERYSRTPRDWSNRVREFQQMVDGFHRAGLRVVMDVVYNHSYAKEMFQAITPRYYTETDLSGCGNSIDARVSMVRRMIQDSLEYWVEEYGVDGFRFDLAGIFDFEDVGNWGRYLNSRFPDRQLLLYGEPWNGYASDPREPHRVRLGTVGWIQDAHFGVFNPKFRDALKGKNDAGGADPGDGFVFGPDSDSLRVAIGGRGAIREVRFPDRPLGPWEPAFAMDPEQSIQYVSAHDNLTLRDKILAWAKEQGMAPEDPRLRQIQKLANGVVLTSQGIPFLHGGVELMRDKQGDHNSYRSPDGVNAFDWNWKIRNADVFEYYRQLVQLRKAHPGFRMNTWEEIHHNIVTTRPRAGVVVNRIDAQANGDDWSEILVIWNSGPSFRYALPRGNWKLALDQAREVGGTLPVEASSVTVAYRE